ncbi:hypothetical protein RB3851 [Rhodopirellula baltica SH 1]|uniref:Uncharacterized protein n=1 Tax=Rhodopirellula baltica (strain DSM 10527 / NCIMB 13988 / SH1) TaxID=243090 RepID=Q7UTJ0_RHOBA|nr:hypothetical protein RB3851 [Rhodopirellula baltica SH 1]
MLRWLFDPRLECVLHALHPSRSWVGDRYHLLLKSSFRQADRILSAFDLFGHAFLLPTDCESTSQSERSLERWLGW